MYRDIRNLFEDKEEKESYYKPAKVSNFWGENYIEYESKADRNKTLSFEKYVNKVRPYF